MKEKEKVRKLEVKRAGQKPTKKMEESVICLCRKIFV